MLSSTYSLVFLTIERYLEIVHPIWHKVNFNSYMVIVALVIIWVIGPVYYLPYIIPTSKVMYGICMPLSIWPNKVSMVFSGILGVVLQYILPLLVLGYCYSAMAYVLHKRTTKIFPGMVKQNSSDNQMSRAKRNLIKTLFIVSIAFILCYSWNQWFFLSVQYW